MLKSTKIQPVILCGGSGTRLWPVSTFQCPKQFIKIGDNCTLLSETLNRVDLILQECEQKGYSSLPPLLVMNRLHSLPEELSKHNCNIVYETYANDTAVAVTKAVIEIKNRYQSDPDIMILVLPADHYIENVSAFVYDLVYGIEKLTPDNVILFGIEPSSPETKYGYIISEKNKTWFKEKPDAITALELIKRRALWNSGIFAANVDDVFHRLHKSTHNIIDWVMNPREGKAPSFDIAVLQEHDNIHVHYCVQWGWSDVGTWDSFTSIPEIKHEMDKKDNSSVITKQCHNVNILNRGSGNVVVLNCEDLFIVINGSDILITKSSGDFNSLLKEVASQLIDSAP